MLTAFPKFKALVARAGWLSDARERLPAWLFANYTAFRSFRFFITLMYAGVIGGVAYINWLLRCGEHSIFSSGTVGLGLVLVMLLGLEWFEQKRWNYDTPAGIAVLLLALRMVIYEVVVSLDCSNFSTLLYALVPFSIYFTFGPRLSALFSVFYVFVALKRFWEKDPTWYMQKEPVSLLIAFALIMFFMQGLARLIRRDEEIRTSREALLSELASSHQALQLYASQVAELAATEERNRLARDIHDSLGHYLTAVNIQLEKAVAYMGRDPQESLQAVQDAKQAAAEALADVRRSVGALRDDTTGQFSLRAALQDLVDGMVGGPFQVVWKLTGQEEGYSRPVLLTLFRAAQEGLTNVQRHAGATQAILEIELGEQSASLSLRDDGEGFDPDDLERCVGYGLRGIRERVELVSGELRVISGPGMGTELIVRLPKNPAQLVTGAWLDRQVTRRACP